MIRRLVEIAVHHFAELTREKKTFKCCDYVIGISIRHL
jgi:hypothetical protein